MLTDREIEIVKAFLNNSFSDIEYRYDGLTTPERKLCTREEFEDLIRWIKE